MYKLIFFMGRSQTTFTRKGRYVVTQVSTNVMWEIGGLLYANVEILDTIRSHMTRVGRWSIIGKIWSS